MHHTSVPLLGAPVWWAGRLVAILQPASFHTLYGPHTFNVLHIPVTFTLCQLVRPSKQAALCVTPVRASVCLPGTVS